MKTSIKVKNTNRIGRGIYATRNIKRGEVIEISPVILLSETEAVRISNTVVNLYVFEWNSKIKNSALALGLGSLFNHSRRANVTYMSSFQQMEIVFMSTKEIKKGSQLFINYGYDPKRGIEITKQNKQKSLERLEYAHNVESKLIEEESKL